MYLPRVFWVSSVPHCDFPEARKVASMSGTVPSRSCFQLGDRKVCPSLLPMNVSSETVFPSPMIRIPK
ncbi:hypothetical protein CEXT_758261 [Caerostris extrusa]|uniref:Uncharacterized protein n=1 Tax=Caerostris extrusa TaxID=172846 RepID=A0AAV4PQH0_CAEEX|nr:hypothetical protein CEXT_758261 [Caerostris extrusa]